MRVDGLAEDGAIGGLPNDGAAARIKIAVTQLPSQRIKRKHGMYFKGYVSNRLCIAMNFDAIYLE